MMLPVLIFATASDIKPVLGRFEMKAALQYAATGKRSSPDRPVYFSYRDIPDVGIADRESGNASARYLVARQNTTFRLLQFLEKQGQTKWLLSNADNEESVSLTIAGVWNTGTLLPGHMSAFYNSTEARQLVKAFLMSLRHEGFRRVDEFLLGREALAMLRVGKRLTMAEQSPPEFDLRLPDSMR